MTKTLTLTASLATAPAPHDDRTLTASAKDRTIAGIIVEYGVEGYASTGPTIFHPGSLNFPAQASQVKFLLQHDTERPLGTMTSSQANDAVVAGMFTVASSPMGDEALLMAQDGRRDGLSVGCRIHNYEFKEDVLHVYAADVHEVSLVTIPAFSSSLVSTVNAAQKESTDMANVKVQPFQLTASRPESTENTPAKVEAPAPAKVEAQQEAPAPKPAELTAASLEPITPNRDHSTLTLEAAVSRTADYLMTGKPASGLAAALTDQVPADDAGEGYLRPQWLGELWTASTVSRPTIESITRKPLNGLKVYGFKKVRGEDLVNPYEFNKTEMTPSGKLTTVPVDADAKGYAGGWDVDRRFIDLGDGSFIRSVFEAAADEYKADTEADAVAAMKTAATAVPAQDNVVAALAVLGVEAATLGSSLSKIQFGTAAWAEFVNLSAAEVPWWLQKQGEVRLGTVDGNAGGLSFNVNPNLAATDVLAYDRRAATWFEKGETPIQVQAVDIARGGVDLGVYGYGAIIINDERAIFHTTAGVADPEPGA